MNLLSKIFNKKAPVSNGENAGSMIDPTIKKVSREISHPFSEGGTAYNVSEDEMRIILDIVQSCPLPNLIKSFENRVFTDAQYKKLVNYCMAAKNYTNLIYLVRSRKDFNTLYPDFINRFIDSEPTEKEFNEIVPHLGLNATNIIYGLDHASDKTERALFMSVLKMYNGDDYTLLLIKYFEENRTNIQHKYIEQIEEFERLHSEQIEEFENKILKLQGQTEKQFKDFKDEINKRMMNFGSDCTQEINSIRDTVDNIKSKKITSTKNEKGLLRKHKTTNKIKA